MYNSSVVVMTKIVSVLSSIVEIPHYISYRKYVETNTYIQHGLNSDCKYLVKTELIETAKRVAELSQISTKTLSVRYEKERYG